MDISDSEGARSSCVFPIVQQLVDSGYLFKNLRLAATALPHASYSTCVIFDDAYCECK